MKRRSSVVVAACVAVGLVVACSDDPAENASSSTTSSGGSSSSSSGSGTSASSSSSSGSASSSSSSSGGGGGDPATGVARMTVTFSEPVDGYNGGTGELVGVDDKGKAEVTSKTTSFASGLQSATQVRTVSVSFEGAPVQGMTYTIATTQDDFLKSKIISYQELDISTTKSRSWYCGGTVKIDSVVGKVHKFSFDAKCIKYPTASAAVGGVTMKGTGIGTLP